MGQRVMGTVVMGHCHFDIKKLLTHLVSPIIIAEGLVLIYDFFALKTERVDQYHHATPLL